MWHGYWTRRLTAPRRGRSDRPSIALPGRTGPTSGPHGTDVPIQREKGIDLRLGLDAVRMARTGELDVAALFSQDQDLAEVTSEVRDISRARGCWLKIISAFPHGQRGIDGTDWFRMDSGSYNTCLDPRDYRPPRQ